LHAALRLNGKINLPIAAFDSCRLRVQPELNSFGFERLLKLTDDVSILTRQNLFPAVHDGYPAAESAKHLPKFEANVPAAEDEEMFWDLVKLHDRFIGKKFDIFQAG
jgi:hypothetical protein